MDVNRRQINNRSERLYSSRICIFPPCREDLFLFVHIVMEPATKNYLLHFFCASSNVDTTSKRVNDYKSISKHTKRAFEFTCSIQLNDEVDVKRGENANRCSQFFMLFRIYFLLVLCLPVAKSIKN